MTTTTTTSDHTAGLSEDAVQQAVNDYWGAINLDLIVCVPLFLVGLALVWKGARFQRLFYFVVGFVGMFIVLGRRIGRLKKFLKGNVESGPTFGKKRGFLSCLGFLGLEFVSVFGSCFAGPRRS